VVEPRIEGERVVVGWGRSLSLEELGALAEKLPWVEANVFIMPPHEYVVEGKLQDEDDSRKLSWAAPMLPQLPHSPVM
jgi:hypothetical protein